MAIVIVAAIAAVGCDVNAALERLSQAPFLTLIRRFGWRRLWLRCSADVDYMTPWKIGRRLYEDVIAHTRLGILPLDAIRAVTSTAADCIRIGGRTGAIRPGLEADLIVVDDDPLTDIETLRNAVVVISDGRVVRNTLTAR